MRDAADQHARDGPSDQQPVQRGVNRRLDFGGGDAPGVREHGDERKRAGEPPQGPVLVDEEDELSEAEMGLGVDDALGSDDLEALLRYGFGQDGPGADASMSGDDDDHLSDLNYEWAEGDSRDTSDTDDSEDGDQSVAPRRGRAGRAEAVRGHDEKGASVCTHDRVLNAEDPLKAGEVTLKVNGHMEFVDKAARSGIRALRTVFEELFGKEEDGSIRCDLRLILERFFPTKTLMLIFTYMNTNLRRLKLQEMERPEFLEFLTLRWKAFSLGITVTRLYDNRQEYTYMEKERMAHRRFRDISRAFRTRAGESKSYIPFLDSLEAELARSAQCLRTDDSIIVIDDDKVKRRSNEFHNIGLSTSYPGSTVHTPVAHVALSRLFGFVLAMRFERLNEKLPECINKLLTSMVDPNPDATQPDGCLIVSDRGYNDSSVQTLFHAHGYYSLSTTKQNQSPFRTKETRNKSRTAHYISPSSTAEVARYASGTVTGQKEGQTRRLPATLVCYCDGSGKKGSVILTSTQPEVNVLHRQWSLVPRFKKYTDGRRRPGKFVRGANVVLAPKTRGETEAVRAILKPLANATYLLTAQQGHREWQMARRFLVTSTTSAALIRAASHQDMDLAQEVRKAVYVNPDRNGRRRDEPIKDTESMRKDELLQELAQRQVPTEGKTTIPQLQKLLKLHRLADDLDGEDAVPCDDQQPPVFQAMVKDSWFLPRQGGKVAATFRRGHDNEPRVHRRLPNFLERHASMHLVYLDTRGLAVNASLPSLAASVDGVMVLKDLGAHGVPFACLLEIKTLIGDGLVRAQAMKIREILGVKRYRHVTGDVARDKMFAKLVPSVGYRAQLLHHAATYNVKDVLFVRATESEIVYATRVTFPDLSGYRDFISTTVRQHLPFTMLDYGAEAKEQKEEGIPEEAFAGVRDFGAAETAATVRQAHALQRQLHKLVRDNLKRDDAQACWLTGLDAAAACPPALYIRPTFAALYNFLKWAVDQLSQLLNSVKPSRENTNAAEFPVRRNEMVSRIDRAASELGVPALTRSSVQCHLVNAWSVEGWIKFLNEMKDRDLESLSYTDMHRKRKADSNAFVSFLSRSGGSLHRHEFFSSHDTEASAEQLQAIFQERQVRDMTPLKTLVRSIQGTQRATIPKHKLRAFFMKPEYHAKLWDFRRVVGKEYVRLANHHHVSLPKKGKCALCSLAPHENLPPSLKRTTVSACQECTVYLCSSRMGQQTRTCFEAWHVEKDLDQAAKEQRELGRVQDEDKRQRQKRGTASPFSPTGIRELGRTPKKPRQRRDRRRT